MKGKILLVALLFVCTAQAQLNMNAYIGSNSTHLLGADALLKVNHVVIGVGGTHAINTFFTSTQRNGNDYSNHNINMLGFFPGVTYNLVESFTEDRGSVSGITGYAFKNTIVAVDAGISFRQRINLYTSSEIYPSGVYSNAILSYDTQATTHFTYGASVIQSFGRLGALVGYNNIQQCKIGITYRITPTKMFNY